MAYAMALFWIAGVATGGAVGFLGGILFCLRRLTFWTTDPHFTPNPSPQTPEEKPS